MSDNELPKLFDLKTFLPNWQKYINIDENGEILPTDDDLDPTIFTKEVLAKLEKDCSVDTFTKKDVLFDTNEISKFFNNIPQDSDLETLKCREEENTNADSNVRSKRKFEIRYMLDKGPWIHHCIRENKENIDPIEEPQILLSVAIYKPLLREIDKYYNVLPLVSHELNILGSQTLADLKDAIICPQDNVVVDQHGDVECTLNNNDLKYTTKDIYHSSTIFIEDVFYNDERRPDFVDYSSHIIDWSLDDKRGIGPYRSDQMELKTIGDLTIRFGHPYLYIHQGNCEHWIVFTDARLLDAKDCLDRKVYPLPLGQRKHLKTKCRICLERRARWVTRESSLQCPEDPCFFCEYCFRVMFVNPKTGKMYTDVNFSRLPLDND